VVTIKTLASQMKYDAAGFKVLPGTRVRLTLLNEDEMPHNLIITRPAPDKGLALAQTAWALGEQGVARNWIPDDPRVLAATKMVGPHAMEELVFTAPAEKGDYPFVCTFPGHAMAMNGVMSVVEEGVKLMDGKFQLFLGSWVKLPDFSKEKPLREGPLEDNLIGWKFDDYKNEFGIRFTGKLEVKTEGEHFFRLTSDDGSRLRIDDKPVVGQDGTHPANEGKVGRVMLTKGTHDLTLDYFQGTGGAALFLSWQGPGFPETWLTKSRLDSPMPDRQQDENHGLPLEVRDEAVIYRNFIEGAGARGIAVGYPGGVNAAFDAELCNVALVWRGAFMDAKRHWTGRGSGFQPPMGFGVVATGLNVPLAVLEKPDTPWPALPKDLPNGDWPAGYRFGGYALGKGGIPTFRYTFQGLKVEDHLEADAASVPPGQQGVALKRVLTLQGGSVPAGLHLRLISSREIKESSSGVFNLGEGISLHVPGGRLRPSVDGMEVVVPVTSAAGIARIEATYLWNL